MKFILSATIHVDFFMWIPYEINVKITWVTIACVAMYCCCLLRQKIFKFITFDQGTRIDWMESVLPSTRRPRPLQPAPRHSLTGSSNGRNTSLIRPHPLMLNLPQMSDILASPSTLQLSRHLNNGNIVIKGWLKKIATKILFICCVMKRRVYRVYGDVTCQKYQN